MKRKWLLLLTLIMSLLMSMTAFAGVWRTGAEPNQNRWWYDNEDGTYAANGWQWIDGNQDGTAECYYFDNEGWMMADGATPDGYQVNSDGEWVNNGVVEKRTVAVDVPAGNGNSIVVYFSKTGTTRRAAEEVYNLVGGDILELQVADAYPSSYDATLSRAQRELNANVRPELTTAVPNMSQYDTVYVGYPIWYGTAPMPVFTFLESCDLSGKTVIPFCTSGSSGIEGSMQDIRNACPGATVLQGIRANNTSAIGPWLEQLGR